MKKFKIENTIKGSDKIPDIAHLEKSLKGKFKGKEQKHSFSCVCVKGNKIVLSVG